MTFSAAVTGVNATDFAIRQRSLAQFRGHRRGRLRHTYTVTASAGSGSGTLGINVVDDDSILDIYSQPLADSLGGSQLRVYRDSYVWSIGPRRTRSPWSGSPGAPRTSRGPVFYRGSGSGSGGSFAIRNTVADAGGSGAASSTTAALGGTATGWTHTPGTDSTPSEGRSTRTRSPGRKDDEPAHRDRDRSRRPRNTTPATLTFTNDSTAPAGGVLKVNGILRDGGRRDQRQHDRRLHDRDAHRLHRSRVVDGVRLVSSVLTIQSATVTNDTCGSYGTPTTLIGNPTQGGLATGCYLFTLTGTDNVGNSASVSTTVIVDTTPPPRRRSPSAPQQRLLQQLVEHAVLPQGGRRHVHRHGVVERPRHGPRRGERRLHLHTGHRQRLHRRPDRRPGLLHLRHDCHPAGGGPPGGREERRRRDLAAASYTAILDSTAPTGGALTVNGVAARQAARRASAGRPSSRSTRARTGSRRRAPRRRVSRRARSCATRRRSEQRLRQSARPSTLTGTPTSQPRHGLLLPLHAYRRRPGGNAASVSTIVKVDLAPRRRPTTPR